MEKCYKEDLHSKDINKMIKKEDEETGLLKKIKKEKLIEPAIKKEEPVNMVENIKSENERKFLKPNTSNRNSRFEGVAFKREDCKKEMDTKFLMETIDLTNVDDAIGVTRMANKEFDKRQIFSRFKAPRVRPRKRWRSRFLLNPIDLTKDRNDEYTNAIYKVNKISLNNYENDGNTSTAMSLQKDESEQGKTTEIIHNSETENSFQKEQVTTDKETNITDIVYANKVDFTQKVDEEKPREFNLENNVDLNAMQEIPERNPSKTTVGTEINEQNRKQDSSEDASEMMMIMSSSNEVNGQNEKESRNYMDPDDQAVDSPQKSKDENCSAMSIDKESILQTKQVVSEECNEKAEIHIAEVYQHIELDNVDNDKDCVTNNNKSEDPNNDEVQKPPFTDDQDAKAVIEECIKTISNEHQPERDDVLDKFNVLNVQDSNIEDLAKPEDKAVNENSEVRVENVTEEINILSEEIVDQRLSENNKYKRKNYEDSLEEPEENLEEPRAKKTRTDGTYKKRRCSIL